MDKNKNSDIKKNTKSNYFIPWRFHCDKKRYVYRYYYLCIL